MNTLKQSLNGSFVRFLMCIAFAGAPFASAQALPVLTLQGFNGANSTFLVRVNVSDVTDLSAYEFDLNFDPTRVQALPSSNPATAVEGPFLASAGTTFFDGGTIDNVNGVRSFVFDTLIGPGPGANGSGPLATFGFAVTHPGAALFTLSNLIVLNSAGNDIAGISSTRLATLVPEPPVGSLALIALLALLFVRRGSFRSGRPSDHAGA
jgi:hypothetical protein